MRAGMLNCRVSLYGKIEINNELDEIDYTYKKIKSIWAQITPSGGKVQRGEGNTTYAEISHKIIVRSKAIPDLKNDMYFIFKGQRYDIMFFNPNYKYRDSIEVFCSLIME